MEHTTIDSIKNKSGIILHLYSEKFRNIKCKIETLIPSEYHNKIDLHGYSVYKTNYSNYVGAGNKEPFEALLEQTLLIEKEFVKELKGTYLNVLKVNGCKCSPELVTKLVDSINIENYATIWNKVKAECFPKKGVADLNSIYSPKM